jgi:hypothetical protein
LSASASLDSRSLPGRRRGCTTSSRGGHSGSRDSTKRRRRGPSSSQSAGDRVGEERLPRRVERTRRRGEAGEGSAWRRRRALRREMAPLSIPAHTFGTRGRVRREAGLPKNLAGRRGADGEDAETRRGRRGVDVEAEASIEARDGAAEHPGSHVRRQGPRPPRGRAPKKPRRTSVEGVPSVQKSSTSGEDRRGWEFLRVGEGIGDRGSSDGTVGEGCVGWGRGLRPRRRRLRARRCGGAGRGRAVGGGRTVVHGL